MTHLSEHFTLEELTESQTAMRRGLDNTPDAEQVKALTALCENVLEPLRELLGCPLVVSSGFRSAAVNRRVGGTGKSQHCRGEAADLKPVGISVQAAFEKLRSSTIDFDQAIEEGTWLHVSFTKTRANRRQALRAKFVGGKAQYTEV
jgi:zinc D-Ala-D-Ala carboxypeptidase